MDIQKEDILRFEITRYLAEDKLNSTRRSINWEYDSIREKCHTIGNQTAVTLLDLLKREFDEHWSQSSARMTQIRNLKYQRGWHKSKLLIHDVSSSVIDDAIKANIDKKSYEIFVIIMTEKL